MLLLTAGSKERSRRAAEPQESHACSCGEDYRTGEEEYPTPCVCCADETRRDDPATQGWDIGVHQCVHPPSMCSLRGANLCHLGVPASIRFRTISSSSASSLDLYEQRCGSRASDSELRFVLAQGKKISSGWVANDNES